MNITDQFRDKETIRAVAAEIERTVTRPVSLMEVCGGHTMAMHRFGIPRLLPGAVTLKSGPGCPVCVTSRRFIDHAVALSRLPDTTIVTFGDLMRVPGSSSSLERRKAGGADIRMVYSPLDAVRLAAETPGRSVVFLAIGFETTAPTTAAAVTRASARSLTNFFVLSSHKIMPPAMAALIDDGVAIDGYVCPGHVSVITGTAMYREIVGQYRKACVISGFEPLDLMLSVLMLVRQIETDDPKVEIEYRRAVKPEGNVRARALIDEVFELRDEWWRGLGTIPASGLGFREEYRRFDAARAFEVPVEPTREEKGCICGDILKGVSQSADCPLFARTCTPENPVGACMVSPEGACAAWYKYGGDMAA